MEIIPNNKTIEHWAFDLLDDDVKEQIIQFEREKKKDVFIRDYAYSQLMKVLTPNKIANRFASSIMDEQWYKLRNLCMKYWELTGFTYPSFDGFGWSKPKQNLIDIKISEESFIGFDATYSTVTNIKLNLAFDMYYSGEYEGRGNILCGCNGVWKFRNNMGMSVNSEHTMYFGLFEYLFKWLKEVGPQIQDGTLEPPQDVIDQSIALRGWDYREMQKNDYVVHWRKKDKNV